MGKEQYRLGENLLEIDHAMTVGELIKKLQVFEKQHGSRCPVIGYHQHGMDRLLPWTMP